MSSHPRASVSSSRAPDSLWSVFLPLLPITLALFVGFFAMGLALPVLPLHVHHTLGQSTLMVGVAVGSQFLSALLSRGWSGAVCDGRGPRVAALAGFAGVACVGGGYLLSAAFVDRPALSMGILVAARLLTGLAESMLVTGMLSWGIGLVGVANAGKVMGWVGIAIFGAFAAGAPVGVALFGRFGFAGIAAATVVVPLLGLALAWPVRAVVPGTARPLPFYQVVRAVWLPGVGLALCGVGFAMMTTFVALLFAERGWAGAALAFTSFGGAFILARLPFGHLPDQLGGARVALVCVLIEAVGQLLIWGSPGAGVACVGAALTGFGYSLAFPGFGVEAVRRVPPQSRGAAMGAYVAFLDLSMGLTAPLGGWLAAAAGLDAVFLAGAVASAAAAGAALWLLKGKGSTR